MPQLSEKLSSLAKVFGTRDIMDFWIILKKARDEFNLTRDSDQYDGFREYMRDVYGIGLRLNADGNIEQQYAIVDEPKYLIFTLKFL